MIALSEKQWKVAIIGSVVLLVVLGAILWWAYSDGSKKEGELIGNIGVATGENVIVNNLVTNQQKVVNEAEKNTNQAVNALRNSVNRDSSQFGSGGAGDRFCRDFPKDSTCQP